tara:strand:+ start:95 stop:406 length:312 start_codon:yes stop_codon:yes gene_type:complete
MVVVSISGLIFVFQSEKIGGKFLGLKNDKQVTDAICGYGLGASCVALFARVGGGIFTKAADVGADLVGKCEYELSEDSNQNPAVIADNVGTIIKIVTWFEYFF